MTDRDRILKLQSAIHKLNAARRHSDAASGLVAEAEKEVRDAIDAAMQSTDGQGAMVRLMDPRSW